MGFAASIEGFGLDRAIDFVVKNPEKNMVRLMNIADRLMGDKMVRQRKAIREAIENKDHPYHSYILRVLNETDPAIMKTFIKNFFFNVNGKGWKLEEKNRELYNCNIPWAILLDPTSACNLHCTGCWAAEYGHKLNLSFDEIDDIIRQGKALGTYMYIYTGGEPLVRKEDLVKLAKKHNDCIFLTFTNGTLIDEKFADQLAECKNFVPAISLEGFEEATDSRRGQGVYKKVVRAINILRSRKVPFGISACYTSENFESIMSEEFYDGLIDLGVYFIWYFHYMPVGNDATPELMPRPEQRKEMYRRLRKFRATKPLFAMDFQNDADYVGGCIAGGRRYLHINANGDVDPCVFIHYSSSNIRKQTLLEALQSPIFMAYHDGQPFNDNMMRPCPMLENPQMLRQMVEKSGAHSTDLQSPESAEHLCAKCDQYAANWKPVAEELWDQHQKERAEKLRRQEEEDRQAKQSKRSKAS